MGHSQGTSGWCSTATQQRGSSHWDNQDCAPAQGSLGQAQLLPHTRMVSRSLWESSSHSSAPQLSSPHPLACRQQALQPQGTGAVIHAGEDGRQGPAPTMGAGEGRVLCAAVDGPHEVQAGWLSCRHSPHQHPGSQHMGTRMSPPGYGSTEHPLALQRHHDR